MHLHGFTGKYALIFKCNLIYDLIWMSNEFMLRIHFLPRSSKKQNMQKYIK